MYSFKPASDHIRTEHHGSSRPPLTQEMRVKLSPCSPSYLDQLAVHPHPKPLFKFIDDSKVLDNLVDVLKQVSILLNQPLIGTV